MMSWPGSPRTRMRPIGPGAPMRSAGSPRSTFIGGASVRSGRCPSRVWMTSTPARRAAASTSAHGPTAALRRDTSLPSAAPKPPGSKKSRCISMMTRAVRPVSTATAAGSASIVRTGTAASDYRALLAANRYEVISGVVVDASSLAADTRLSRCHSLGVLPLPKREREHTNSRTQRYDAPPHFLVTVL